jgi:hypothetical protein
VAQFDLDEHRVLVWRGLRPKLDYEVNDPTRKDAFARCRHALISDQMSTTFTLEDECPVGWPTNMSINVEYPLTPARQESAADLVQRIYLESLWLPDVRESTFYSSNFTYSHLLQSIMPVEAVVYSLRRIPRPSTTPDEPHPLASLLRPLFLSADRIQTKYGVEIPKLLDGYDPHPDRELQPEENMILFAWHHGKPPAALLNHSGEVLDEERWRRTWMRDAERRE